MKRAIAAAHAGDWASCLSRLLELWRDARSSALADVIDRVGKRCVVLACAPRITAISARIATATDVDVEPIVTAIRIQIRTDFSLTEHAIELAKRPDPRVADLLGSMLRDYAIIADLVEALVALRDPRQHERILEAAARYPHRFAGIELPDIVDVAPEGISQIDAELERSRPRDASDLLAAVYADPANLQARLVYADALQEANDLRGEFIALQINTPDSKRAQKLLHVHERVWLGAIEECVKKTGLVYRNGFVAAARITQRSDAPEWRTLEEVEAHNIDVPWLMSLPVLRRVLDVSAWQLEQALDRPVGWTTLGLGDTHEPRDLERVIKRLSYLPALTELDLSQCRPTRLEGMIAVANRIKQLRRVRLQAWPDGIQRSRVPANEQGPVGYRYLVSQIAAPEVVVVPQYSFQPDASITLRKGEKKIVVGRQPDWARTFADIL